MPEPCAEAALKVLARSPGHVDEIRTASGFPFKGKLQHVIEDVPQPAHVAPHLLRHVEVQSVIGVDELVVSGDCLLGQVGIGCLSTGLRKHDRKLPRASLSDQKICVCRAQGRSGLVFQLVSLHDEAGGEPDEHGCAERVDGPDRQGFPEVEL
ncbi:hypothetical protein ACFQ0X_41450 [Streptomyces rectiviolaceus]|uniref:hypothetical protein n=1 Tax=Streptomyces rectiviolaceus TaxID=332591 RepID=UPI0031D7E8D3